MTAVVRLEFEFTRHLAPDGAALNPLPAFATDRVIMVDLYRAMVLTRVFDAKAVALQRTGRLGTYASSLGQEAAVVGTAAAMRPEDVLLPSFREQGAMLWRGVAPEELLLYWGGDERGSDFAGPREDFPISIPVASHAPHAAGAALAFKLRHQARVAVCMVGDGATSKGDFYEALNVAGLWRLPAVFVVCNNQWAISVPRARQTAAETLAQKAVAAGIPGEQADGNDAVAVRDVVGRMIERARGGGGASLVELITYRLSDHTTADDASRYRDDAEVSPQWKNDPVARLRNFLVAQAWWDKEDEETLLASCAAEVERAVADYLATSPQAPSAMVDFLYAALPTDLKAVREALARIETQDSRDG